jgi:transcriptional regulator with XRE-family HTH domain
VPAAVARQQPVLQLFPTCGFAKTLEEAVGRILEGEKLSEADAPLSWRVRRVNPSVSTHGLSESEISPPRLSRKRTTSEGVPELASIDFSKPGEALRRRREQLGLTLAQMSEKTRLRCLEALECEALGELPAAPYLLAQVREYARALRFPSPDRVAEAYVKQVMENRPAAQKGLLDRLRSTASLDVLPRRRVS